MISKVDLRDFYDINTGLYGENLAHAASVAFLLAVLDTMESRNVERKRGISDRRR